MFPIALPSLCQAHDVSFVKIYNGLSQFVLYFSATLHMATAASFRSLPPFCPFFFCCFLFAPFPGGWTVGSTAIDTVTLPWEQTGLPRSKTMTTTNDDHYTGKGAWDMHNCPQIVGCLLYSMNNSFHTTNVRIRKTCLTRVSERVLLSYKSSRIKRSHPNKHSETGTPSQFYTPVTTGHVLRDSLFL